MPNTSRATIEPMVANCASCSAVALVFAPRSRMCVWPPLRAGTDDMIGARSTGPTVFSTKCAIAVSAPVLPALTIAPARPSFTRSMAMRMEESLRRRIASRGCSDMPTTVAAGCTDSARAHAAGARCQRGFDDGRVGPRGSARGRDRWRVRAARRVCTPAHRCRHSSHRRRSTACVTSGGVRPAPQLFFGLDFGRFFDDALAAIKTVGSDAMTQVGFTRLRIDGQARASSSASCERCMPRLDGVLRLF